jgi:predicted Fe-S protein YdhL (DUF1289 family)
LRKSKKNLTQNFFHLDPPFPFHIIFLHFQMSNDQSSTPASSHTIDTDIDEDLEIVDDKKTTPSKRGREDDPTVRKAGRAPRDRCFDPSAIGCINFAINAETPYCNSCNKKVKEKPELASVTPLQRAEMLKKNKSKEKSITPPAKKQKVTKKKDEPIEDDEYKEMLKKADELEALIVNRKREADLKSKKQKLQDLMDQVQEEKITIEEYRKGRELLDSN